MKRILACLMMLCLFLTLIPGQVLAEEATSGSCGEGVTWKLEEGTLTISGSGEMSFESQPWFIHQQEIQKIVIESGVTSIAPNAFSGCWPLDEISLPEGLVTIGDGAFSGSGVKEITLPSSVTTIGKSAFSFCSKLTEITIPNKVSALADSTFEGCHNLTSVELPNMLISIGSKAFSGCGMQALALPASVTSVGSEAFSLCEALMDVQLPNNLTSLGSYAFSGCISLEAVSLPDALSTLSEGVFYQCQLLSSVELPAMLVSVGDFAFSGCSSLETVQLPATATTIGESAFVNCTALESVSLPAGMTAIGTKAFMGCTALKSVDIPQGIAYIAPSTFESCSSLETVTLPTSLTEIGDRAFVGCALAELTVAKNVTKLGEASFKDNGNLICLTLPISLNRILGSAFAGCYSLADVYYPGTQADYTNIWIEELNDFLKEATWHYSHNAHTHSFVSVVTPPTCTQEGFTTHTCDCTASYTDTFVAPYGHDYRDGKCQLCNIPMTQFADDLRWGLDLNGKLTISGNGAMPDFSSMKDAPWYEFRSHIREIVLEPGVTSVGSYAFSGCGQVTKVSLPEGLTKIGFCAFSSCSSLADITLPQTLTNLGAQSFYGCKSLTTVSIPSGITSIGGFTFYGCSRLEMVVLPVSVTSVVNYGFAGCTALASVNYEGTETDKSRISWGSNNEPLQKAKWYYSFSYHIHEYTTVVTPPTCAASGYTTYTCECEYSYIDDIVPATGKHDFKEGVCSVCSAKGGSCGEELSWILDAEGNLVISGTGAMSSFQGTDPAPWAEFKDQIQTVTIREGVTTVSDDAFAGCGKLTRLSLPETMTQIGKNAFAGSALAEVTIPKAVKQIGEAAFQTKGSLQAIEVDPANTAYADVDGSLLTKDKKTLLQVPEAAEGTYLVPETVEVISSGAFSDCADLTAVIFQTDLETIEEDAFAGCSGLAELFYTGSKEEWDLVTVEDKNLAELPITFDHRLGPDVTKYTLIVPSQELGETLEAFVDGAAYPVEHFEGNAYIQLPDTEATNLTVFTYNKVSEDVHEIYPTGMKIWMLSHDGEGYYADYIPEFDDMLQYAGSSIRIVGKKGIRMITSIPEAMKKALTGKGLAGYTLMEYGTALALTSEMGNGPLVLGATYTKSNHAYKKGVADPVFSRANGKISFTNVLVGFTNDQCKEDIAMRPYIILKDARGNQVTIYGGIVYRSIGYIAYQNRTAFQPKTNAYDFVWSIIHHVYGDKYDADYKG